MNVSLKENFTKEQRDSAIKYAWKTMGLKLYDLCQDSKEIKPDVKTKLTKPVCEEYARQQVVPFLNGFASGDFTLSYDETHAISLANTIKNMKPSVYDKLIEQIKSQENIPEK